MAQGIYRCGPLTVTYTARTVRNDYGVPGSPVWYEPEDVALDEVTLYGHALPVEALPVPLLALLYELADSVEDWEH